MAAVNGSTTGKIAQGTRYMNQEGFNLNGGAMEMEGEASNLNSGGLVLEWEGGK